jgi:transposase-like protein
MKTPLDEPIDLVELMEEFGSDDKCRTVLEQLRWPDGPSCPRCQSKATKIANRFQYDCDSCHYQFSVTVGTIFHDSHLSLWKWFLATYLLTESKKGMSACQIQRMLKTTYKTSWYLCHRIRAAMLQTDKAKLDGTVEIDETYVGGKAKFGSKRYGLTGRGTKKEIVIGIRQRNGQLRMFRASDVKAGTIAQYIRENVSKDVDVIITDDFASYPFAMERAGVPRTKHKTIKHSSRVYVMGDIHTNTVESAFSLLKRGIMGTWHRVSVKHLPAYLDEMCFRFNNRKNPYLFRDTVLKLIASPNLEYKNLTAKAKDAA